MPEWLIVVSWISIGLGIVCAAIIVIDLVAVSPQKMWIMDIVWPVTALYSGPLGLWAYYRVGRLSSRQNLREAHERGEKDPGKKKPFWQITGVGATHCGAGCTLADIFAEWIMVAVPWTLFGKKIFAAWVADYVLAFAFGIAFQYFTIAPMRNLGVVEGLKAAVKADTLSLTAWQVGMYGWMAIVTFLIFNHELEKTNPVFWFMMQIAMLGGFLTSYPVNWWLLKSGMKEKM